MIFQRWAAKKLTTPFIKKKGGRIGEKGVKMALRIENISVLSEDA